MPDQPPPVDPDDRPVFEALLAAGVEPGLAYTALQRIRDVAAANLIAQLKAELGAKIDALGAAQRETAAAQAAEIRAQAAEIRAQRWMVGAILALLAALLGLGLFNSFLAPAQTAAVPPQPVIVVPATPAPAAASAATAN